MKSFIGIRDLPHYRRDAFAAGLKAAGHSVSVAQPSTFDSDTLYVCWNRYGHFHDICTRVEQAGGKTIICENGYCGRDENQHQFYALARGGHNGSGQWYVGGPERWAALGVELQPWRADGGHILVCGQRGIGSPTMASPSNWHEVTAAKLRTMTKRQVRVRAHPGNQAPTVPLADDLRGAWACVIWSSGAGVQALVAGIPVLYDAPHWICALAAGRLPDAEAPPMDDAARIAAMQAMACAQWSLAEIASGEPFRRLLGGCAI